MPYQMAELIYLSKRTATDPPFIHFVGGPFNQLKRVFNNYCTGTLNLSTVNYICLVFLLNFIVKRSEHGSGQVKFTIVIMS
jgi:hypothetical protein